MRFGREHLLEVSKSLGVAELLQEVPHGFNAHIVLSRMRNVRSWQTKRYAGALGLAAID